jgi:hypothetical protein
MQPRRAAVQPHQRDPVATPVGPSADCSPRRFFESTSCPAHTIAYLFPCALGHTLSASRAAGGEPPLLNVHIGVIHLCTNSAARAAGGETPLLKVHIGDMHLCTNSAARAAEGETPPLDAPGRHAPAQASAATRAAQAGTPRLSQSYTLGEVLVICRSTPYCLSMRFQRSAPLSCPTHCRRASAPSHTFRDTLGRANVARLFACFYACNHYEALCPFRYL